MTLRIKSKFKIYEVKNISKLFSTTSSENIYIIDKNVFDKFLKKKKFKKKILLQTSESLKNYFKIGELIKRLIYLNIKKNTKLIAIGGGILQDVVAFTASIIFRGIKWEYYPTTLLSQGDSCIGSKTSINFGKAKNQIGNFYPPEKIFIYSKFLEKLKIREIYSGLGELAHYYLISKKKKWVFFKDKIQNINKKKIKLKDLNDLAIGSLKIKKTYIEKDEFDKKERLILNYGHSFGHAIEKITNHKIPHGLAVAHGINIANYFSYILGYLKFKTFNEIEMVLKKIVCLKDISKINTTIFLKILKKDKKNIKNNFWFVLSKGIGKMFLKEFKSEKKVLMLIKKYLVHANK